MEKGIGVMGFYSSHIWKNGAILTVERANEKEISIRIQAPNEGKMLADFLMGEFEALCLISAMTTVLTKRDEDELTDAILKPKKDNK